MTENGGSRPHFHRGARGICACQASALCLVITALLAGRVVACPQGLGQKTVEMHLSFCRDYGKLEHWRRRRARSSHHLFIPCPPLGHQAGGGAEIRKRWSCHWAHIGPVSCPLAFNWLKATEVTAALFQVSRRPHKAEMLTATVRGFLCFYRFQRPPDGLKSRPVGHQKYS